MMQPSSTSPLETTAPSFASSTASGTSHRGKVRVVMLLGIYGLAWWIPYQGGQGLDSMMATAGFVLYNNYSSTNTTNSEASKNQPNELKIRTNEPSSSSPGIPTHATTSTNSSSNMVVVVEPAMLLQAKIERLELEKQALERKILQQAQKNNSSATSVTANENYQQQLDRMKLQMQQLELKEQNLKQWEQKLATLQQELEKDKDELKKLELQTKAQILKKKDSDQQAGACMLIMDDNHLLIEWIAYHYHTLPLRRLILLSDPDSRTTPQPILDRWEGRINFTVWNESRIFPRGTPRHSNPYQTHILRQQIFISQCIHTLTQEADVNWVLNIDTDEFLMVNDRVYDKNDRMYGLNVSSDPLELPSPSEPGYVLKFIQQTIAYVHKFGTQNNPFLATFQTPCLGLSRKQFGTYEDEKQDPEEKKKDPPFPFDEDEQGIQPSDLGTWRWRYWGGGVIGKTLIHLPRLNKQDVPGHGSVHRPILREDICSKANAWAGAHSMPLVANHYPATLDQGMFRTNDSRSKSNPNYRKERYEKERLVRKYHEPHSHILEWVNGFVMDVGLEEAARLLQYAGNVTTANNGTYLELANATMTSEF